MKKIDWNQAINTLASLGVILGIVFLAIETRQNSQMMRAQTRNEIAGAISDLALELARDPELAQLYFKARTDFESLTPLELIRFNAYVGALFRAWENTHFQHRSGLFDEAEFEAERHMWQRTTTASWFASIWCSYRDGFSRPFVQELEALHDAIDCAAVPPLSPFR